MPSVGPNRMSYFLDLRGPSEPIETACSSALIAIHRGVRAILSEGCGMVVAGGVNTLLTPEPFIIYGRAGMLSPTGRCRTFSAQADGYVRGEGVGMVVLRRLRDAEAAGDRILGIIRASAENHGGRAQSLTAPNPQAQADLVVDAWSRAGIDPRSIGYIEAHGTGTPLGDPIEVDALKQAFTRLGAGVGDHDKAGWCRLGSVKSNIGHTELAAGVAGVIKVLLQLQHGTIVPSLHAQEPNPYLALDGSPFRLADKSEPWVAPVDAAGARLPRRAG
ncbi:polyketide synthase, partial [Sphingobium yanoikuyae]|uniref:beta-ketoacyl [acyl carrier protein] synthase domain-containing protein n=1 Tax=Sphingobium yanoikuyae TaxID=13690 RepID=UPI002449608F